VNTPVARLLGGLDVVILVEVVSALVVETRAVKLYPKRVELVQRVEDQAATRNVVHSGQLHLVEAS
jgi:hypothetical protein